MALRLFPLEICFSLRLVLALEGVESLRK
jgi:hypothetical protein